MDGTAERLLRESIAGHRLKRNSKEEARWKGVLSDQCPLCDEYLGGLIDEGEDEDCRCVGCPVEAATHDTDCGGTPWQKVYNTWDDWLSDRTNPALWEAYQKAEDAEIAFLERLLPEAHKENADVDSAQG